MTRSKEVEDLKQRDTRRNSERPSPVHKLD